MAEERGKELAHPRRVDPMYLCELIERRIAATGYRLRERGFVGEMAQIYENSIDIIRAINRFLELPEDDLDGMLQAIVDLNIGLKFYRYPVTGSRRFRDRLSNHIGWTLELADARRPTDDERRIVDRLLEADFSSREEIRDQLRDYLVGAHEGYASLSLYPKRPDKLAIGTAVPVSAEAQDEDGATIYVRLHVIDGWIRELEIVKSDGSRVIRPPEAGDLTVHQA